MQAEGEQTAGAAAPNLRAGEKRAGQQQQTPQYLQQHPIPGSGLPHRPFQTLDQMQDIIEKGAEKTCPQGRLTTELTPLFDQETTVKWWNRSSITSMRRHFSVENFRTVWEAGVDGSSAGYLPDSADKHPSPYAYFIFPACDLEIAGASPGDTGKGGQSRPPPPSLLPGQDPGERTKGGSGAGSRSAFR